MKFAHFAHVWGKRGMSPHARYEQLWRELALADEVGFDYGFSVEHHFTPNESWMSSPNLYAVAAAARTKRLRVGAMGHVVALHHPVRLLEEIALTDQLTGGRTEVGLVPGILPAYFEPYKASFPDRREVTLEFARFMKAAYAGDGHVTWDGKRIPYTNFDLSVMPLQRPHPPMWLETRDIPTLEFCAREGLHTPNIAFSTVVYVDETYQRALDVALADAANAYKGFFSYSDDKDEIRRKQVETAEYFLARGEPDSAEITMNILDPEYLLKHELILLGTPDTVAKQLRAWSVEGSFNTFFGEFNFGEMAEDDLMRSIRLFGTEVIPQLRDYEPI